jgi:dsDNA-specific endonuclease/ATPase MutS2
MTNHSNKEIAVLLEEGPTCDIWYDARKFGDDAVEDKINKVQSTMLKAARLLRAIDAAQTPDSKDSQEFAEMAAVLTDGAADDIWYNASDYNDFTAAKRISKTQEAMNQAAKILSGLSTEENQESTMSGEPYTQNVSVCDGLATLEDGTTVDLLKIQAAINSALQESGDLDLMAAADQLSLITQKHQGPHGEWQEGSYIDKPKPSKSSGGMSLS